MIGHIFLIIPQKLPDASQFEAQIAISLVRFVRAVSVERSRLKFPSRLSRVHTSDKGREEGRIVVVDERHIAAESFLVRTLTDVVVELFVHVVLGNQMLKLEPQK